MTLRFVTPQLATLVDAPPADPGWIFETKYDGYRLQALIERGRTRLITRNGHDWSAKFPEISEQVARLPVRSAILDGEVVALDADGRSRFGMLQEQLDGSSNALHYFLFDLLAIDGTDRRDEPLRERRQALQSLLRAAHLTRRSRVRLSDRLVGAPDALIRNACAAQLEGIIGKRLDAPYRSGRGPSWVKVKCGGRQEFIVVGFTPPRGRRVGIGSLLLAVNEHRGLRYAGRVGSGLSDDQLREVFTTLATLERKASPLATRPAGLPGGVRWVEPIMVVEIAFTEWTRDGALRHPVFQGIRLDKSPAAVHREKPKMLHRKRTAVAGKTDDNVVAGVTITHPDRVVFPEVGITKLELAQYLEQVAPLMLPHVAGRPLALVRCPEGAAKECFFQKHWTGTLPPAITTVAIRQSDGKKHPHVVVNDVAGLVTLAQWGVLEIHPWGARADDPERPDRLIFDLDPAPGLEWGTIVEAALGLRGLLRGLRLDSWVKTSGGKGLHVVVPIARRGTWDEASAFSRAVAEHMQREFPDRFLAKASKAARQGRIFVDWLRNTRGATAVAPWSPRARASAGISVPVPWTALSRLTGGDQFTVRSRPKGAADPWQSLLASRQILTKAMRNALGSA